MTIKLFVAMVTGSLLFSISLPTVAGTYIGQNVVLSHTKDSANNSRESIGADAYIGYAVNKYIAIEASIGGDYQLLSDNENFVHYGLTPVLSYALSDQAKLYGGIGAGLTENSTIYPVAIFGINYKISQNVDVNAGYKYHYGLKDDWQNDIGSFRLGLKYSFGNKKTDALLTNTAMSMEQVEKSSASSKTEPEELVIEPAVLTQQPTIPVVQQTCSVVGEIVLYILKEGDNIYKMISVFKMTYNEFLDLNSELIEKGRDLDLVYPDEIFLFIDNRDVC